jgi:hypothetical protein
LQNRQSAIRATLPWLGVAEPQAGDEVVAEFARWAALERVGEAAKRRARERWLRDQASSTATWIGMLVDIAEQGSRVVISVGGRKRTGRVVGVGADFCVVEEDMGRHCVVAVAAITSVAPRVPDADGSAAGTPRSPALTPTGDRRAPLGMSLAAALGRLAEERSSVTIVVAGRVEAVGDIVSAAEDFVTVRQSGQGAFQVHVPVAAIEICELR